MPCLQLLIVYPTFLKTEIDIQRKRHQYPIPQDIFPFFEKISINLSIKCLQLMFSSFFLIIKVTIILIAILDNAVLNYVRSFQSLASIY